MDLKNGGLMRNGLWLILLVASCTNPAGERGRYSPGDSGKQFISREEALSIVKQYWVGRIGGVIRRANEDELSLFFDGSTHHCPYTSITKCELRQGGVDAAYYIFIHSRKGPAFGARAAEFKSVWHHAGFNRRKDARLFADALTFLSDPTRFKDLKRPVVSKAPAKKQAPIPKPTEGVTSIGKVTSINKRWGFVAVKTTTTEHETTVGDELVCRRRGRVITRLVVTKADPTSITCKPQPQAGITLIRVGDEISKE